MFLGHHAVAFAAKRMAPRVSLGTLVLAATFIDLIWPIFLILGLEVVRIAPGHTAVTPLEFRHYPFTHSLVGTLFWAVLVAVVWFSRHRSRAAAIVLALAVTSHWVLDAIVHRPDMPVLPGGPFVGLGLWNSLVSTLLVEGLLFAAAVAIYVRTTRARGPRGTWVLASFVIFLLVVYAIALVGMTPPSEEAVAYTALTAWLLVGWAYWADGHRDVALDVDAR